MKNLKYLLMQYFNQCVFNVRCIDEKIHFDLIQSTWLGFSGVFDHEKTEGQLVTLSIRRENVFDLMTELE